MNRIVIAIFSALMLLAFPSQAQQIIVVASCPATLSPPLNQGAPGRLTVDVNGILCTNASGGGGGGGAITAAANSYATGFSPDIGVFGSMVPYQGSGTANVINLLGGIEEDARGPLATQANSVSVGGVGILAPLGTQTLANSVAVTAADGTLVTVGTTTDSAWAGTGNATLDAALKGIYNAAVSGTAATGSTTPTSAVLFGISDGSTIRALAGTSAGVGSMGLVNVGTTAVTANAGAVGAGSQRIAVGQDATTIAGAPPGRTYNTIAASQTVPQALTGGSGGATGDYLSHCVVFPTTVSPGAVTILDNSISIDAFAGGTTSLSNLSPFTIPVGAVSVSGAWKVTTGPGLSVTCVGKFT